MRKPFNKISIVLLLALVALLCLDAYIGWIKYLAFQNGVEGPESTLEAAASAIWHAIYIAGLVTLIEIVDQILWHRRDGDPAHSRGN